jgi:GH18 family chitinase
MSSKNSDNETGGWGGCYYFSQACSTSANRNKFANAIATAVNTYNLDGKFIIDRKNPF